MFCATPLRSTVKETVYSTVETVQHSIALMGHGSKPLYINYKLNLNNLEN